MSDKVILVSCDSHVGPRLREDLRPYCPKRYLDEFDTFTAYCEGLEVAPAQDEGLIPTKGGFDSNVRAQEMEDDGVAAEIIFHGSQNGQPVPFNISDPVLGAISMGRKYDVDYELAGAGRRIYNEWLADFCADYPGRRVGLVQLPMWDIDETVEQLKWAASRGLRGVNFPAESGVEGTNNGSRWGGRYAYNDPVWEPVWAACEDLGFALTTHNGAGTPDMSLPGGFPIWLYDTLEGSRKQIQRLVFGGVFERHPNLRAVMTEEPGLWWSTRVADYDSMGWAAEDLPKRPGDYLRSNVAIGASFPSRREMADAVTNDYWRNIMWGNDYPHSEGTWRPLAGKGDGSAHTPAQSGASSSGSGYGDPYSHLQLRWAFEGIVEDKVRAMVGLNAIRIYNLDQDLLQKVANQINAPTIEQLQTPLPEDQIPEDAGLWAFRNIGAFG